MAKTSGKKESRALELTPAAAELLHDALEAFIAVSEGRMASDEMAFNPKDKSELRVLSKRARELAK